MCTIACWLLTTIMVMAQSSVYFFYDPACMQKFDYEKINQYNSPIYTDYYISTSNETKAIFRVQKMRKTVVSEIPVKPFMCEDRARISTALIKEVNANRKMAYIVVEIDGKYALHEVRSISKLTENATGVVYEDPMYGFKYDYTNSKTGEILNKKNHKERNIFFENKGQLGCLPKHTFKIVSRHIETPIKHLDLVQGLGVQRLYTTQGELRLKTINDRPIQDFMAQKCQSEVLDGTLTVEEPKDNTQGDVTVVDTVGMSVLDKKLWLSKLQTRGLTARSATPIATATTTQEKLPVTEVVQKLLPGGIYLVKEKENLYTISEKFGVSVHRLVEINNLDGYELGLNQALKVVDDGSIPKQSRNPLTKIDEVNKTKTIIHVVEQGQTLYSISKLYGLELKDIYNLNKDLTDSQIDINQRLVVGYESF